MGERSYSSALGSFLSEDPVFGHFGTGASVDRYLYVLDNPVNRYDLQGRDVCIGVFVEVCAEDVGNAANTAKEAAESAWNLHKEGEEAINSGEKKLWNLTEPARHSIANRAHDFWKNTGSHIWREISGRAECLARAVSHPEENQECLHSPEEPYEPTEFETEPPHFPGPPSEHPVPVEPVP
jgi:hypothetical protein